MTIIIIIIIICIVVIIIIITTVVITIIIIIIICIIIIILISSQQENELQPSVLTVRVNVTNTSGFKIPAFSIDIIAIVITIAFTCN